MLPPNVKGESSQESSDILSSTLAGFFEQLGQNQKTEPRKVESGPLILIELSIHTRYTGFQLWRSLGGTNFCRDHNQ